MAAIREAVGGLAGEFGRDPVDLDGAVLEVELRERDRAAAEGIGLHHIGAGLEIAAMNLAHEFRAGEVEHLGAVLAVPVVALDIERQRLDTAAHAAVAEQNLVAERVEKMGAAAHEWAS